MNAKPLDDSKSSFNFSPRDEFQVVDVSGYSDLRERSEKLNPTDICRSTDSSKLLQSNQNEVTYDRPGTSYNSERTSENNKATQWQTKLNVNQV